MSDRTKPFAIKDLNENGRYTPVRVEITKIDKSNRGVIEGNPDTNTLVNFASYAFSSSMVIPVDAFNFTFHPESLEEDATLDDYVREGDLVSIYVGDVLISTGIIDTVNMSLGGRESFGFSGRDMLGMLETQDSVTASSEPTYFTSIKPTDLMAMLKKNTRIPGIELRGLDDKAAFFSSSPGESKLAALLRFLEPLNALAWCEPNGTVVLGRPSSTRSDAEFILSRKDRYSNVKAMDIRRESGRIPNAVLGIWTGTEYAQGNFVSSQSANPASRPKSLRDAGHIVNRTVVVGVPNPSTDEGASKLNALLEKDYVDGYVKRLMARENMLELNVTIEAAGHNDLDGNPFLADTNHHVICDRANIDEELYCYEVNYSFSAGQSPSTSLSFCKPGCIVAEAPAP